MKKWWGEQTTQQKTICIAAVAVIAIAVISVFLIHWRNVYSEKKEVDKGVNYLKSLEKQEVSEIKQDIEATNSKLNLNRADTDEATIWSEFENAVILGDSRALGFSFHEFVPAERVMAEGGGKITDVEGYIKQLKKLNPKQIILCFGLNDIGIRFWPETSDYCKAFEEQMELLKKELPESTVYINSILPAIGVGLEADTTYVRIDEYNQAIKQMCIEKGYHYIDNAQIVEAHADLYQEDGLHVEKEFYKYWAANMLAGMEE